MATKSNGKGVSKSEEVRKYLEENPNAAGTEVIAALKKKGLTVDSNFVSTVKGRVANANYPRHTLRDSLRIPRAILEQNAGKPCPPEQAAGYLGLTTAKGPFSVEISSGIKYGFLDRPSPGSLAITELARQALRPQKGEQDEVNALRKAFLQAPLFSDVYLHYRGENLPDEKFFSNALTDSFKIPDDKVLEFKEIFLESLQQATLAELHGDKLRIIDVSGNESVGSIDPDMVVGRLRKEVNIKDGDSCFVMMPFASPHGGYYVNIFEPAIRKAGLVPIRADAEIFGTGKIIDQIWRGINQAKVLVAELTTKNANVFYELGLAHALRKPVVLVSSNEDDVPFDLHHIRVIYYDVYDPFWGQKLIDKIAENVVSALGNPEEAIFQRALVDK